MSRTGIINYGSGNFTSVWNALTHLGIDPLEIASPQQLADCDRYVLPGVGAFPAAMERLAQLDLIESLSREVHEKGKPLLGICVGMQVLANVGFEFRECQGLGYVPGQVRRFDVAQQRLRVPHIGWNELEITGDCPLFRGMEDAPSFYFVHSYYFKPDDAQTVAAQCDYGNRFCAAVQRDNVFGVQFHPEKSQRDGLTLLENFCSFN